LFVKRGKTTIQDIFAKRKSGERTKIKGGGSKKDIKNENPLTVCGEVIKGSAK